MSGTASNDDHPCREAQGASNTYVAFASASKARRPSPARRTEPGARPVATTPQVCHYSALVQGDLSPTDLRAAVGQY